MNLLNTMEQSGLISIVVGGADGSVYMQVQVRKTNRLSNVNSISSSRNQQQVVGRSLTGGAGDVDLCNLRDQI